METYGVPEGTLEVVCYGDRASMDLATVLPPSHPGRNAFCLCDPVVAVAYAPSTTGYRSNVPPGQSFIFLKLEPRNNTPALQLHESE